MECQLLGDPEEKISRDSLYVLEKRMFGGHKIQGRWTKKFRKPKSFLLRGVGNSKDSLQAIHSRWN